MKVMVVGSGLSPAIYDGAFVEGFKADGHDVLHVTWQRFFVGFWGKVQNKFLIGFAMWRLNRNILRQAEDFLPDLVFVYRGTHVFPSTIQLLQARGAKVFGYNNDDPFSSRYSFYVWRLFKKCVRFYDHVFAYRVHNVDELLGIGAQEVSVLRSYYRPDFNFPCDVDVRFACDAVFIGHYEDDGRDAALLKLKRAGVDLRVFGTGWEKSFVFADLKDAFGDIVPLYGADYNLALNAAKIALVFLSKLNRDTYTRRCFEIPAAGTCMVCEFTKDLAENLFLPDVEAVYFEGHEDLVAKVKYFLQNDDVRDAVGSAGRARLLRDGHGVEGRVGQVLAKI